ncbi:uncharacterized protein LOC113277905 isoform X2 [Papaver somniferum]|nr:uncharacterized protein LOC113277905 isoform X2 [Papaver somniferum]
MGQEVYCKGNTNTLAGNVPPKANFSWTCRRLNGLNSSSMIEGGNFDGAKAYKDSKIRNMLTCKSSTDIITRRPELHLLLSALVALLVPGAYSIVQNPFPSVPEVHYQGLVKDLHRCLLELE